MAGFAIPLAVSGLSALSGLFGGRSKTAKSSYSKNYSGTSTSAPSYSPEDEFTKRFLANTLYNRAYNGPDLSGYLASGLRNTNRAGDIRKKAISNIMAARGLSVSPVASAAEVTSENQRLSDIMALRNQVPLLQYQLQGEDLNNLLNFFRSLPYTTTQTQTGTESGSGENVQSGDMLGGLFSGLGQGLAATLGRKWAYDQYGRNH